MDTVRLVVAVLITAVWAVVVLLPVIVKDFDAPVAEVTPIMLLAATYLLGRDAVDRLRGRNGNGKGGKG